MRLTVKESIRTQGITLRLVYRAANLPDFVLSTSSPRSPPQSSFGKFVSWDVENPKLQKTFLALTDETNGENGKMKTINISKVMFVQFRIDWEFYLLLSFSALLRSTSPPRLLFFIRAINMRHDIKNCRDKTNTSATMELNDIEGATGGCGGMGNF